MKLLNKNSFAAVVLVLLVVAPSFASAITEFDVGGVANGQAALSVPTNDVLWNPKWKADVIATEIVKRAINAARDIITRWIVTGRFDIEPVFSTSFSVDLTKTAENASRIFLSKVTGINFCAGFNIPSTLLSFTLTADFGLTCSLPSDFNPVEYFNNRGHHTDYDDAIARLPENDFTQTFSDITNLKAQFEGRAVGNQILEWITSQGFFSIKDPNTGKTTTPGSFVASLVMENTITSPAREADVASTIQQAIGVIIDTAIRVYTEKGLSKVFGN